MRRKATEDKEQDKELVRRGPFSLGGGGERLAVGRKKEWEKKEEAFFLSSWFFTPFFVRKTSLSPSSN